MFIITIIIIMVIAIIIIIIGGERIHLISRNKIQSLRSLNSLPD